MAGGVKDIEHGNCFKIGFEKKKKAAKGLVADNRPERNPLRKVLIVFGWIGRESIKRAQDAPRRRLIKALVDALGRPYTIMGTLLLARDGENRESRLPQSGGLMKQHLFRTAGWIVQGNVADK